MRRNPKRASPESRTRRKRALYAGQLQPLIDAAGGLPLGKCRLIKHDLDGRVVSERFAARDLALANGLEAAAADYLSHLAKPAVPETNAIYLALNRIVKAARALRMALGVGQSWELSLPPSPVLDRIIRALRHDPTRADHDKPADVLARILRAGRSLESYAWVAAELVDKLEGGAEKRRRPTRSRDLEMALWIDDMLRLWTAVFEKPLRPGSGDEGKENALVRFVVAASQPLHKPPLTSGAARKQIRRHLTHDDDDFLLVFALRRLAGTDFEDES